jgi:hypothetical protein
LIQHHRKACFVNVKMLEFSCVVCLEMFKMVTISEIPLGKLLGKLF